MMFRFLCITLAALAATAYCTSALAQESYIQRLQRLHQTGELQRYADDTSRVPPWATKAAVSIDRVLKAPTASVDPGDERRPEERILEVFRSTVANRSEAEMVKLHMAWRELHPYDRYPPGVNPPTIIDMLKATFENVKGRPEDAIQSSSGERNMYLLGCELWLTVDRKKEAEVLFYQFAAEYAPVGGLAEAMESANTRDLMNTPEEGLSRSQKSSLELRRSFARKLRAQERWNVGRSRRLAKSYLRGRSPQVLRQLGRYYEQLRQNGYSDRSQSVPSWEAVIASVESRPEPRVAPVEEALKTITNSIGMKLALIPSGEFLMGSPESEVIRDDDEMQHRVRITKPYYLGAHEVTQGQWESVMGTRPWSGEDYVEEGDDYAATYVSWEDAVEFCRRLSEKEGREYHLPTEAEWEYACRAGSGSAYCFGDDRSPLGDYAWYCDNASRASRAAERYAHRVAQNRANAWGLHDMHGNVWEWCSDWYDEDYYTNSQADNPTGPSAGSYRVMRGGSWYDVARDCRSASRSRFTPDFRSSILGFRVAFSPVD